MVTGGEDASLSTLDSSEQFDIALGSWSTSGAKLPRPMRGLRATNINARVLIFGIILLHLSNLSSPDK